MSSDSRSKSEESCSLPASPRLVFQRDASAEEWDTPRAELWRPSPAPRRSTLHSQTGKCSSLQECTRAASEGRWRPTPAPRTGVGHSLKGSRNLGLPERHSPSPAPRTVAPPRHTSETASMKEDTNTSMGGIVHEDMRLLLETNMPASSKKKVILGVADPKIGAAVQEEIGIQCQTGGVVAEIIRDEEFGAIELGREPDDQRALVEVRDLYKEMERFLILFPGFKIRTEKSITQLRRVADDIDTCHRCASVATVVGSGTSAVGGTLLVAGLLAAPFTGGISLLLTGAGVVGGITSASASITETMMNKSKQGEVDEIIERYNSDSKLLMESFNMAYGAIDGLIRLSQTEIAAGLAKRVGIHPLSVGQKSYTLVSTILAKQTLAKTSRLQRLAMEVSELYGSLQSANFVESTARIKNLLFGMPHVVPSSAKLATKALSTAFVAWDIYSLVTETIDLRKGSRTELAQQVRAMADRIKEKLWAFQGIYRAIERYMLEGHGRGRRHAAIEGRF